jgi:RND family efflux transporter MFP subunit
MNRRNRAVTRFALTGVALAFGLAGCSNERRAESPAPEIISNVSVIAVQNAKIQDWLEAVGTVRAAQTSKLASQMMGNIVEVDVREGDRVQSNQVLAVIDDAQSHSAVERAAAAVTAAQKEVSATDSDVALAAATLRRYQQLFEKKSVSPQEFDEIKARHQSAEARRDMARAGQAQAEAALSQAQISLGYTKIRAPFAGVVTERSADPGAMALPGTSVFTVEDTRGYRLEAAVDESDVRIVRIGQTASVTIDALGNAELSGKVVQIVPAADPASRSFLVKVELPADTRLRSGLFGRARFARDERSSVLIPRSAIVERGQLQGVYVIDANQTAGLRYITLGKAAGQQVEVLSGLQEGEKLVAAPANRELGGKRITERQ